MASILTATLKKRRPEYKTASYRENLRQILEDPDGHSLRAIIQDHNYVYYYLTFARFLMYGSQPVYESLRVPLIGLLALSTKKFLNPGPYLESFQYDIEVACRSRLIILLDRQGKNWYKIKHLGILDVEEDGERNQDLNIYSVTLFARRWGALKVLKSCLEQAGWSPFEILDVLDKELYLGVPGLLDGSIEYKTRRQCQQEFLEKICTGQFSLLGKNQINSVCQEYFNIMSPLCSFHLSLIVSEANSVFNQRSIPGAWPLEMNKSIGLIPGKNFAFSGSWKDKHFCAIYKKIYSPWLSKEDSAEEW
jgi:hypothetical protein